MDFREARVVMAAERPSANYAVMRSEGVKEVMKEFGITSYVTVDAGGLESAMVRSRMTAYLVDKDGIGNIDRLSPMMVR